MHNGIENKWAACRNILCVRLDNMGDVLMSGPAMRAIKNSFHSTITLLTSTAGAQIAPYVDGIDDVIVFDAPWVSIKTITTPEDIKTAVGQLKEKCFDGAVIFSTFSQNPMPSILIAYLAEIPLRLAYCRENPYQLLTDWIPEKEPYAFVKHQVRRDLDLVKKIGAQPDHDYLRVRIPDNKEIVYGKLKGTGVVMEKPWVIIHPGVSEQKRQFSLEEWIVLAKRLVHDMDCQVVITGSDGERDLADAIVNNERNIFNMAGQFTIDEFLRVIEIAPLLISVNTSAIHIAAAVNTRVVVLYAMTNPQHTPWRVPAKVFPFDVPEALQSKNEILRYVRFKYFSFHVPSPSVDMILQAAKELMHATAPENLSDSVDFKELLEV